MARSDIMPVLVIMSDEKTIVDVIYENGVPYAVLEWADETDKQDPLVALELEPEHLQRIADTGHVQYCYNRFIDDPRPEE